jgi:hypothetical protein
MRDFANYFHSLQDNLSELQEKVCNYFNKLLFGSFVVENGVDLASIY